MSCTDEDEGSVSRVGLDSECGERVGPVGLALRSPQSREGESEGEGEGRFPEPKGFVGDQHMREGRGLQPQGCKGQPEPLADFEGATLAYVGNSAAMATPQGWTDQYVQGFHRSPSPKSCKRQVSTIWLDPEPAPTGRGARAHGWVGSQLASGIPFHLREPMADQAWESPKKGVRCRSKASVRCQPPNEEGPDIDPESVSKSSDEVSEMHLMRLIISQEGGGEAKPTSPNDTPSHSRTHIREKLLPTPGSCLSSAPPPLTLGVEGPTVGDPEVSSKKPQRVTWGKAGSRPSYLPLVAAAGTLPKATPRWKVAQQKTSQVQDSEVAPGRLFPSWRQRGSIPPLDSATIPLISNVSLPGRGRRHALVHFGTKESMPIGAGQKSEMWRRWVSKPVVGEGEDKEPKRDAFPESQETVNLLKNLQD
ncbi:uncharacterized protein CXorf49 homolog [Desmodus rotundus]|uniref:uncharacterized protein CXorf49 homolog n=1 Tax=Desmodus rotundus TaxID=9430 RepID=UPI000D1835F4|nr:uncharacterized protein CXorf49 homolog [Desmodus rotundus]